MVKLPQRSEIALTPGTFFYSLDRSKAALYVLVGPIQNKLEDYEGAVIYDKAKGRMVGCPVDRAVQSAFVVPAGSYATVTNPYVTEGRLVQPKPGEKTIVDDVALQHGRIMHVPGPSRIIPWPGQEVTILDGFRLARDQYVIVEVVDSIPDATYTDLLNLSPVDVARTDGDLHVGARFVIGGNKTALFIPPTGVRVLGGIQAVKRAVRLTPLQWCRMEDDTGGISYVYGTDKAIVYPDADRKIIASGDVYDLRKLGLHLRSREGTESFLTEVGSDGDDAKLYWPVAEDEIINTIDPIEIGINQGVYVRPKGQVPVVIREGPYMLMVDPLRYEVVDRDGGCFAPAIVVQDNDALEINSPTGTRIALGPTTTLLQFHETEGRRLPVISHCTLSLTGIAADATPVQALVAYEQRMTGPASEWFRETSGRFRFPRMLESRFRNGIQKLNAPAINTATVYGSLFDDSDEELTLNDVTIAKMEVQSVELRDSDLSGRLKMVKRSRTLDALVAADQAMTHEARQRQDTYEQILAELDRKSFERTAETETLKTHLEAEKDRVGLERQRAIQHMLDEIATAETERDARHRQHNLDFETKRQDLEVTALTAHAQANVVVLNAIQPELIAAIRAAGVHTNFGKVVQHLGPSALLNGLGLDEALKRLIGKEAAASLLLTDPAASDKPNGRSKQQSVEQ